MSQGIEEAGESCCASCGIAEIDDIQLKECDGCDLVKYCSDMCRENHNVQHEEACKKRAAELRDELLLKQPEGHLFGDCPICCLPLSLDVEKFLVNICCAKFICKGCDYANKLREAEMRLDHSCPFCREAIYKTDEERTKQWMKRIEAKDTIALRQEGTEQNNKGDYIKAIEYWTQAAKLGDAEAHCKLAGLYHFGDVVEKNKGKCMYHLEEAAIGGHPLARYHLGCIEWENGNYERAVKHWIISSTQGDDNSIKELMDSYRRGECSKDELGAALRAHQAAVDATKSPQRDAAEVFEVAAGYYA